MVPDSCSTATALFCGIKANHKTAGVDPTVEMNDCEASLKKEAQVESFISWAQSAGKATGLYQISFLNNVYLLQNKKLISNSII